MSWLGSRLEPDDPTGARAVRAAQQVDGVLEVGRAGGGTLGEPDAHQRGERQPGGGQKSPDRREQGPETRLQHAPHDGGEAEHGESAPGPDAGPCHEWLMRLAAAAAPNPLSMLTTVTPAAQELSMPSSAATPPNEAP